MPRHSADVVPGALDESAPKNEHEAQALAAINASWQDESERTDVMQPRHLLAHALFGRESEREPLPATHAPQAPPRAADDPCWDDEQEETFAVDFERLAPWHVPELTTPFAEEEKTEYFERTADFQLLDSSFVTEYTDRHPALVAGTRTPASPPVTLQDDSGSEAAAGTQSALRTARLRPAKRTGSDTIQGRGRKSTGSQPPEVANDSVAAAPITRSSRVPTPSPRASRAPAAHVPPATPAFAPALRTSSLPPSGARRQSYAPEAAYSNAARFEHAHTVAENYAPAIAPAFQGVVTDPHAPEYAAGITPYPAAGSGEYARSNASQSQRLAPLPLTSSFESDLRGLRRRTTPAWLWAAASALAAVALVFAVRAWSTGQLGARELAPPPVSETSISAVQREETGFSITSQPEGAKIYVDGRELGLVTPARVKRLSPGLHSVELELAGHYDTSLPAVLQEGATLQLAPVQLRPRELAAAPAVAVAPTGAIIPQLAAAPVRSARARDGHRSRKHAVSRNAPQPSLDETPEAPPAKSAQEQGEGTLRINSRPWARILIDDAFVGNTPQRALRVAAGVHSVRLVNEPMNMSKSFRVELHEGETLTRVETLLEDTEQ